MNSTETTSLTEQSNTQTKSNGRVHRVGTVTAGVMLIAYGVSFTLSTVFNLFHYSKILYLWPFVLIGTGLEMLVASGSKKNWKYDFGSAVILVILVVSAIGMGFTGEVLNFIFTHVH